MVLHRDVAFVKRGQEGQNPAVISADEVGKSLLVGGVPDEELVVAFRGVLPVGRLDVGGGSRRVEYHHPTAGHVLDVVYDKNSRIQELQPTEKLTDEIADALRQEFESAFADAGDVVFREILFSMPESHGRWKYNDTWQILPAPRDAPRPDFQMGDFPLILEHRVRRSTNHAVQLTRRMRGLWELHLLLSLLLWGRITRESPEPAHHWVIQEPHQSPKGEWQTAYLQEGYIVGGGFQFMQEDFTDSREPLLTVVPDDEYYARRGIGPSAVLDIPEGLNSSFDRFAQADIAIREALLRSAYWYDLARRGWRVSKSLSFISAVNAIEALFPDEREGHQCPECKRFHDSPGPTARFRTFVETYGSDEGAEDRDAIYRVRSDFVHGRALHGLDAPRGWGAMTPQNEWHRDLHDSAVRVARTVIRTWFLAHS